MEQIAVKIGSDLDAIKEASKSIMDILNAHVDNTTMQQALCVLQKSISVDHTVIHDCNFTMNPNKIIKKKKSK
jgi:predicted metal-dependent enzyme (double-stranded beta helix superfamily)